MTIIIEKIFCRKSITKKLIPKKNEPVRVSVMKYGYIKTILKSLLNQKYLLHLQKNM